MWAPLVIGSRAPRGAYNRPARGVRRPDSGLVREFLPFIEKFGSAGGDRRFSVWRFPGDSQARSYHTLLQFLEFTGLGAMRREATSLPMLTVAISSSLSLERAFMRHCTTSGAGRFLSFVVA
jgi:hypothetical protein